MDDLNQRPLGPISIILNFSKVFWWKLKSNSFHQKKNWEFLMKIEDIQALSHRLGLIFVVYIIWCKFYA